MGRSSHHDGVGICQILDINTHITSSIRYPVGGTGTDRILALCERAGAAHYLSGPSALRYLEVDKFENHGVVLHLMDYDNYPEYHQLYGEFQHKVSILDLIFNEGSDATKSMKSFNAPKIGNDTV